MAVGSLLDLLRRLDRWRLCLVVFAVIYGFILTISLSLNSMMWDEVTHFTGGLLLSRGQIGMWVWTNSLYPPVYDIFTAFYYFLIGPSVFAGRLTAVTFSVLSIFVVYEIAKKLYNVKIALVSAILFSVMPGIVWVSRMAMIETMLIFIFSVSMLFFFSWLRSNRERDRIISVVAFFVGIAVKYQTLVVVPIIMLTGMFFWKREYLKAEVKSFLRLPRVIIVAVAVVTVAIVVYALSVTGLLNMLLFTIQEGTAQKAVFSSRYPTPIFYFIEMTWFDSLIHPISLLLYLVGLAGLGWMAYRRKREDKFLLLWFVVVYVVFTIIPNREWRYVTIAFPVLAIAASGILVATFDKLIKVGKNANNRLTKKWGTKIAAALLVVFALSGIFFSCVDAYNWVNQKQVQVHVDQATYYAAQTLGQNQTLVVACPLNRFNQYMLWFYLDLKNPNQNYSQVWQYPELAVDAYTPDFNVSQFKDMCLERNVRYVLLYEFGDMQYFNSELTEQKVFNMLNETGRFTLQATFGTEPNKVFVLSFN